MKLLTALVATIALNCLPAWGAVAEPQPEACDVPASFREAKDRFVADFEKSFLVQALRRNGGNITKAAEEVGMYRQNFQQKMRELGISADDGE